MKNYIIPFCLLTFLLFSCETDSYEKGQGKYSLMMADMGEVTVNSDKQVIRLIALLYIIIRWRLVRQSQWG